MDKILRAYGLDKKNFEITPVATGHINKTYKLIGTESYILQRVNKDVFKDPGIIASNLRLAANYLKRNFPEYLFVGSIPLLNGNEMVYDRDGFPWRLFPYRKNTITIDQVGSAEEAFSAASAFGGLTRCLDKIETKGFMEVIPRFHDLELRFQQFESSLKRASAERMQLASESIEACQGSQTLVDKYKELTAGNSLRLRITHNDTKINNVLFDTISRRTVAVIDLDTLMPGYFIYDLGDMVRTFVCPVSEEEKDLSKIIFRKEIYDALLTGYLSEMGEVLSPEEKKAVPFAGKMMTYIMAMRFLTDYLNNDVYYHTTYPGQNLVRAKNQCELLRVLMESIPG